MPWLLATIVATLYLVPIDSLTLPIPVPFDARPDRVLLALAFGAWILVVAVQAPAGRRAGAHRYGAIEVVILLFLLAAVASVALNLSLLQSLNESGLTVRKLVLVGSYVAFYLLIVGVLRPSEAPALVRLIVGLATVAAAGTVIQYTIGINLFYRAAEILSPPGTSVEPSAILVLDNGRPDVTGPARHGLAISTMLAMTLPLALVGAVFADERRERWLFRIAALVIFVGCVATLRRSGIILPFVAISAVVLGGGRRMVPLAVTAVVLLACVPFVAPATFDEVRQQFSTSNLSARQSVAGRTDDYTAVVPDIRSNALVGRGFGSYDARRYRFLDNQYLALLIEVGVLGTAAYLIMILTAAGVALRLRLATHSRSAGWIGLAIFGSMLAFVVANALFDTIAFPQAPYAFMLLAGLAAVSRRRSPDAPGDEIPASAAPSHPGR